VSAYLDYAGIGIVRERARTAMREAIEDVLAFGSPHYGAFFAARGAARKSAAALLGCDEDEIALTANTTAGLQIVADGLAWRPGDEIVVFERDFPANVQPWRALERKGVVLRWVPMRDGRYDLADIAAVLGPATRLVAVSHVHFITGVRVDLHAIGTLAREHGALVCVDAVQSLGAVPVSLSGVDFLAAGGHKWLGGPPGTGLLYCRRDRLESLAYAPLGWFGYDGSDHIFGREAGHLRYALAPRPAARRFEGGMLNFVGIVGLAAAIDDLLAVGVPAVWARVDALATDLRTVLREHGFPVLPGDSGIVSFASGDGARIEAALAERGVHCSYVDGHIRISPHFWTTDAEIGELLTVVTDRGIDT
jgi:selenocysteine lyase/cysteine desulfurase